MWCWHSSKSFTENSFNHHNHLGVILVPMLQMRKLRHRGTKELAHSYLANKCPSQYSTWDILALDEENPVPCLVHTRHTTYVHSLAFRAHHHFLVMKWNSANRMANHPVCLGLGHFPGDGTSATQTGTFPGIARQSAILEARGIHSALFPPTLCLKQTKSMKAQIHFRGLLENSLIVNACQLWHKASRWVFICIFNVTQGTSIWGQQLFFRSACKMEANLFISYWQMVLNIS